MRFFVIKATMKALILAGGRGSRMDNFIRDKNKAMIKLFEEPILKYNLDRAIEAGVKEIIIVVCYKQEEIMKTFGREYKGVKITYSKEGFRHKELGRKGVVDAIETAKWAIGESDFILMFGDELLIDADIVGLVKKFRREDLFVVCGVVPENDKASIGKTYTAMVNEKGRAFRLIEKPKVKLNNIKGTGYCIFKNEILDYIDRTPVNAFRNQKEMVDMIQCAIDDGKKVCVHPITKNYTNINTREDYELAVKMIKENMPKVLIVHNQMKHYGGAELLIVQMANYLTKMGIRNDILTLSKSKRVEEELLNTELIVPENRVKISAKGYDSIKDILEGIKIFRREIKRIEKNYDVINFHDFPTTWSLWPKRKPAVWFMNQPPNLWSRPNAGLVYRTLNKLRIVLDRRIIRRSMDVITLSDPFNRMRAWQRYGMKSHIVFCGIDHDFFSGGNAKKAFKEYGLENRFIIMQSGQIAAVKNPLDSIKTLEKLKDKIPNVLLILTGKEDPEYKEKVLDRYIKEHKLEKYVKYILMFGEREKLRDLYKVANVGLFPIGKQGGWLAPFEMICAGIPIVISSDMGIASIIKENNLGSVTKNYSKAILEIYNNQEKYKKQAREAALFTKNNLSWKLFTERMVRAFIKAWKKYEKK